MNIQQFQIKCQAIKVLPELEGLLTQFLKHYGINTFSVTYYGHTPGSMKTLPYEFSTENFKPWHEFYIESNYNTIDTTLDDAYMTCLPIYWNVQQQLALARNAQEKQMRQDSLDFGIKQGLSIPIHGPHDDFVTLTLVQMKDEDGLENWEVHQFDFLIAAYCYYERLSYLVTSKLKNENLYNLSQREIQCLKLVAKHFSTTQIAHALDVSERTVHFHIQNLNKKLGSHNKYQSVIKAMQKGLL